MTNNYVVIMNKGIALLVLVILSALAGCSFSLGDNPSESQETAPATTPVNDGSDTTVATTELDKTGATSDGLRYGADTDTGEILLSLPELGAAYNFSSESQQRRSELTGSDRESFADQGLLKRHERVFSIADSSADVPPVIISTAIVYESESEATSETPELVESIQEAGGTSKQVDLASGIEATRIMGETQTGRKNILMTWQTDNLVIWVFTSGIEQYYPERTEEYLVEMVLDVP